MADRADEILDAAIGLAGQSNGEAKIDMRDNVFMLRQHIERCPLVADCGLGECIAQHGARLIVAKFDRIAEGRACGFEPTGFKIGRAKDRAVARIARLGEHGGFGKADGLVLVKDTCAGGADAVQLASAMLATAVLRNRPNFGPLVRFAFEPSLRRAMLFSPSLTTLVCVVFDRLVGQLRFMRSARASRSSISSSIASRACVTSAWALMPCMVDARRSLRCRSASRRSG